MTAYAHCGSLLDDTLNVLSRCCPGPAMRARAALEVLLRGVRGSSWPEVAWVFSELTPQGFPVELTFSLLASDEVRYTVEPAGPEMPEAERIRETFRLYQVLSGCQASVEVQRAVLEMQAGRQLFYGAWFGGVHGPAGDRYKIYAEVPDGASLERLVPDLIRDGLPLPHCHSVPVMFGYQPDRDMHELYFRARGLATEDLGWLLWQSALGHRYCEMLELIEATCGRPGMPAAIQGFSLASDRLRGLRAVSVFANAPMLFGSDAHVRSTLLQLGRSRNWPCTLYEQATETLQHRSDLFNRQGVIAWIVAGEEPIEVRIGLWPYEPAERDVELTQWSPAISLEQM